MSGRSKDVGPLSKIISITPAATLYSPCRAVIATVAGTITGVDANGNTVTAVPVNVGVNPYQMVSVTAATATGLFFGY
jgi:hypothetical protein